VIRATRVLRDPHGFAFPRRRVTVSTSGLVPGIERLGKEADVSLAVSLNASEDSTRGSLMPVNRRWPIQDLLRACRSYPADARRRITFEYVLLGGVNDTVADAERLARLVSRSGLFVKVNLIPYNPHAGASFGRPTEEGVSGFRERLSAKGITATIRVSKGRDILAACGQLRSEASR